jgi:ribosomal protein S18 acetylase RimI-like enzyme
MAQEMMAFRTAREEDCTDLALLMDAATRRLASWLWLTNAAPAQSLLEHGRERIRTQADGVSHFSKWVVAEIGGRMIGGFNGYPVSETYDPGDINLIPEAYRPGVTLETMARGEWFLQVVGLLPEHRGCRLSNPLMQGVEAIARRSGRPSMALQVHQDNAAAIAAYHKAGFAEAHRVPCAQFPLMPQQTGDVILMRKMLS